MTSINRVDQAVLLLREQIQRLSKQSKGKTDAAVAASKGDGAIALASLKELRRRGEVDERQLRRALVRALLTESLGAELVTSAGFQAVADRIHGILDQSEEGRQLVDRALTEIS